MQILAVLHILLKFQDDPLFHGEKRVQISVRKESAICRKKQERRSNRASAATTKQHSFTTQTHSCGYDVCVNCKALLVVCSHRITKRFIQSLLLCLLLLFLMLRTYSMTTRGYCTNSYLVYRPETHIWCLSKIHVRNHEQTSYSA